jgi:hypothetical protein
MPRILRDRPFSPEPTVISQPGLPVISVVANQIVVWVSISRRETESLPVTAPRIPAVLDTGFTGTFLVQERQLSEWCGIPVDRLPRSGSIRIGGATLPIHAASVWLCPNLPGRRDEMRGGEPLRLSLNAGLAIWPSSLPGARRLPLLGMEALQLAGLQLNIDFLKCRVSLRTARHWWWFD